MPLSLFQGKIEESVRNYQEDIVELKNEIHVKNEKLEELQGELSKLNGKFMRINEKSTCYLCLDCLLNQDYIIFPCDHNLHKSCSFNYIKSKQLYSFEVIEEIKSLTDKIQSFRQNLKSYNQSQVKKFVKFYTDAYRQFNSPNQQDEIISRQINNYENDMNNLQQLHKQLDSILCKECPLCGPIQSDLAFLDYSKDETWTVE